MVNVVICFFRGQVEVKQMVDCYFKVEVLLLLSQSYSLQLPKTLVKMPVTFTCQQIQNSSFPDRANHH